MIEEEKARRDRLELLRRVQGDVYPPTVSPTHTVENFLNHFDVLQSHSEVVTLVGRARTIRKHGGLTFVHLDDGTSRTQLVFHRDVVGEEPYVQFYDTVDMGDFLEVTGKTFITKRRTFTGCCVFSRHCKNATSIA